MRRELVRPRTLGTNAGDGWEWPCHPQGASGRQVRAAPCSPFTACSSVPSPATAHQAGEARLPSRLSPDSRATASPVRFQASHMPFWSKGGSGSLGYFNKLQNALSSLASFSAHPPCGTGVLLGCQWSSPEKRQPRSWLLRSRGRRAGRAPGSGLRALGSGGNGCQSARWDSRLSVPCASAVLDTRLKVWCAERACALCGLPVATRVACERRVGAPGVSVGLVLCRGREEENRPSEGFHVAQL